MRKVLILALVGTTLMSVSCKTAYEVLLSSSDVDAKYTAAMDYFAAKKYQKSAQLFESMAVLTNGTERDDTVQYYWGLSNYRARDYQTAESNFSKFLSNFPQSPFAQDAAFYRLDCLYRGTYRYELDQTPTRACMQAIDEFMRESGPDNIHAEACLGMKAELQQRLDRKDYEAGKQYYRMEDYLAARVKLKNVLKANSDNYYREDILYYTAMSSYNYARLSVSGKQRDRYLTFIDDYLNFAGEYPQSRYMSELTPLYTKVQKIIETPGANQE